MTHRQSPRRAGRIDVAAPETLPRRRSHAYFPCDKGDARLRRGDARHLPQPRACVRPDGRRAGRGAFCPASLLAWAIRRALRRAGSTRVSVLTASASIASPPSGLITSDSTASAPTGSIASAPATLAATSFSSAAGAVGVGAAFPLRLGPRRQIIVGRRRAGHHQCRGRSRSRRRRRGIRRRLRHPQAYLRQQRQICRRATKPSVLTELQSATGCERA